MKEDVRDGMDDELEPECELKGPDSFNLPPEAFPKEWKPEEGDKENGFLALLPG